MAPRWHYWHQHFVHLEQSRLSHRKDSYSYTSKQLWTIILACINNNSVFKTCEHHKHCSPENRKTPFPQYLDFPQCLKALFCNMPTQNKCIHYPQCRWNITPGCRKSGLLKHDGVASTVGAEGPTWMPRELIQLHHVTCQLLRWLLIDTLNSCTCWFLPLPSSPSS